MKKFLSMMLTTILVLSMSTVAFAATTDSTTGKFTDEESITITKEYVATNADTTSPAENLTFIVEKVSVEEAGVVDAETGKVVEVSDTDFPMISVEDVTEDDDEVVGIALEEGNATTDGTNNILTIKLPEYKAVGIYTYTVTEVANNYAGVTYYTNPITVVVTVIQDGENQIRVAAVHTEVEGGEKSDTFENTYSAGTLEVSKTVTGNMGDTSKYWEFTVTFTAPQDTEGNYLTVGAPITINTGELSEGNLTTMDSITTWKDGKATATVYLKDGETISFENIPYGVSYDVVETEANKDGYKTTVTENDGIINADGPDDEVAFTNEKTTEVDTGITLDSAPYMMMLIIAAAGIAFFLAKKRRYTED